MHTEIIGETYSTAIIDETNYVFGYKESNSAQTDGQASECG